MSPSPNTPFIALSFLRVEEVPKALALFGEDDPLALMIEARVSSESLRDIHANPGLLKFYPDPKRLPELFSNDPRALNIVRYGSTSTDPRSIHEDMLLIRIRAGAKLHGFFLDFKHVDPKVISQYQERVDEPGTRIMVRIGPLELDAMQREKRSVDALLEWRINCVTDIIFDPFGKKGDRVDNEFAVSVFMDIVERYPNFRVALGGAAKKNSGDLVKPFRSMYPPLSVIPGKRLRHRNNQLDYEAVGTYFKDMRALLTTP